VKNSCALSFSPSRNCSPRAGSCPFLRDWPPELVARPVGKRSLPVVAALRGLSRLAAPRTRELVEAIEALAGEFDWRQAYGKARAQGRQGGRSGRAPYRCR
jgi:hypothetical protein